MLDALVYKVGMQVDMKNTPTMENVCEKLILNFIPKWVQYKLEWRDSTRTGVPAAVSTW